MIIHTHATYRDGAIHPDHPLGLPDNTEVNVVIVPVDSTGEKAAGQQPDIAALRPPAPRFTSKEIRERLAKHAVRVGSLPPDLSREEIYSNHD
jgi:hypothetical protein